MTKLKDLIYSLATLIIRYHQSQIPTHGNKLIEEGARETIQLKSRHYAISITDREDYEHQLEILINQATQNYSTRNHFLHYVLHEITYLKNNLNRSNSFSSTQLDEYTRQITKLLSNMILLINTPKTRTEKITYSNNDSQTIASIDLEGLGQHSLMGTYYLCNSGTLLEEDVLHTLNIRRTSTPEELKNIAVGICLEHQNSLRVPELEEENSLLKIQLAEQEQLSELEKSTIAMLKAKLEKAEADLAASTNGSETSITRMNPYLNGSIFSIGFKNRNKPAASSTGDDNRLGQKN